MLTVYSLAELESQVAPASLVIGNFDGVHLGHRFLIKTALEKGRPTAAVTFSPHPGDYFNRPVQLLTSFEQRSNLLEETGLDALVVLQFNDSIAELSAEQFSDMLCLDNLKVISIGSNFRFGKNAAGDIGILQNRLRGRIEINPVNPVSVNGSVVSSTLIRYLISSGQVEQAALMLGRPYSAAGLVVEGLKIGRMLGFPTANVKTEILIPSDGVYVVRVLMPDSTVFSGAASIGARSTFFSEGQRAFEVFIDGFSGDIYGKSIEIQFVMKLREQIAFPSKEELVKQISLDIEKVRRLNGYI